MTAALVLLCHVWCACGGMVGATAVHAHSADEPAKRSACHGHGGGDSDSCHDQKEKPTTPEPEDGSCQHCKRPATAFSEKGKNPDDLRPTATLVGLLAPFWSAHLTVIPTNHIRLIAADLPPPGGGSTLLSLHCALNT